MRVRRFMNCYITCSSLIQSNCLGSKELKDGTWRAEAEESFSFGGLDNALKRDEEDISCQSRLNRYTAHEKMFSLPMSEPL